MSDKKMQFFFNLSIISLIILGILICLIWYPLSLNILKFNNDLVIEFDILKIIFYIFFWFCSIPCFYILINAFKISKTIGEGIFFNANNYSLIKRSAKILFFDLVIYTIGSIVVLLLNFNLLLLANLIFILMGVTIGFLSLVFSNYLLKAYTLKKEMDEII